MRASTPRPARCRLAQRLRRSVRFFFNDPAPPEISPLPLPDALPICHVGARSVMNRLHPHLRARAADVGRSEEHTSELQSPGPISYAVFCFKKKEKTTRTHITPHQPECQTPQPPVTAS